jgi:hypothetical protein
MCDKTCVQTRRGGGGRKQTDTLTDRHEDIKKIKYNTKAGSKTHFGALRPARREGRAKRLTPALSAP